mmetsp:Transcript_24036/g.40839  ORF Transcript_24036/g.40839 Transcript_24036/m.40839 type:complete len:106 (+) Transcript_24036:618-935(+)
MGGSCSVSGVWVASTLGFDLVVTSRARNLRRMDVQEGKAGDGEEDSSAGRRSAKTRSAEKIIADKDDSEIELKHSSACPSGAFEVATNMRGEQQHNHQNKGKTTA